jgi:hypothetical protein
MERRREDAVQMTFEAARSVTENGELSFSDQEESKSIDALEGLNAFRESGGEVGPLSLRLSGKEIGTLDFAKRRKGKIKIGREQPLQIFKLADKAAPELLLATYVPVTQKHHGSYLVALNDHQSLRLNVKPLRGDRVQLKISCITLTPAAEKAGTFRWFRPGEWFSLEFIAVAIGFLIVSGAALYAFFHQAVKTEDGNNLYTARNEINDNQLGTLPEKSPKLPGESNKNVNAPIPKSSNDNRPSGRLLENSNPNVPQPAESGTPEISKGRLRSGSTSNRGLTSLRDVHKLFVDEQENGFKQLVRSAVVKRLGEMGFITEVSRADSDARLRLKWESDNSVRFQILSGDQELLNFKTVFDSTTPEAAEELAIKLKEQVNERLK